MRYRPSRQSGINPIWVLIGVNVLIFVAEWISRTGPGVESSPVYSRFALQPYDINNVTSQPWTLVTYMFLHADWTHILFNMIALYFLGTFTVYVVGETAFLVTYFVGGILGGLFVLLYSSFSPIFGVIGASGAIFALGGLLMVLRPDIKVMLFPIPVEMPLWIAILINFVLTTIAAFGGVGIAWQAHLGGLVYGLVIGYYLRRKQYRRY
jgi:membrane associated rhomboid family serine protease